MATPYKESKSGIYYVRVTVPQELRTIIGRCELKKSLRTKNERDAVVPAHEFSLEAK